ncbi:MAG TPA: hypothetical protein VNC39_09710 [Acidocella sp.]|jgi:hypothetical protein|uniref:hypothetical protein n=1 Tax=Acidocella sp. TaxID=50710 RepID=UPI002CE036F0|nr:hypothetical protein [Acidocella sp.]HVE22244.1 hypothetical protein [Acidocella sp.]
MMSQKSYNFVLWAVPRFQRTFPACVVTTTPHGSSAGVFSSEQRVHEEEQATAATATPRHVSAWRYALS